MSFIYQQMRKSSAILVLIFLVGCQPQSQEITLEDSKFLKSFDELVNESTNAEQKQQILEGVHALRTNNIERASRIFNNLLTKDPTNSGLHTLNALAYQLRGKRGDVSSFDLAEAGFLQAKKYNPNNVYASLQLGRVKADKKDYVGAQEEFAEVLLYQPQNEEALYELASVSYLIGDVKTARMGIDRLLNAKPNDASYVRAGAIIYAVQGERDKANKLVQDYNRLEKKQKNKLYLTRRVNDWFGLHDSGNIVLASTDQTGGGAKLQAEPSGVSINGGQHGDIDDHGMVPTLMVPNVGNRMMSSVTSSADAMGHGKELSPAYADSQSGMVVIDAIILRVIDEGSTSKGQNILENFTLSLAPFSKYYARNAGTPITGASVFPLNNTSTGATGTNASTATNIPGLVSSVVPNMSDRVSLVAGGISFGTLNYSLNIANVQNRHIEIIGRPTLTSHVGMSSEFFNGEQLNVALSSTFGGGNINQFPTGLTLRVTPTGIDENFVALNIQFIDSFLKESEQQLINSIIPNSPFLFSTTNSEVKTTVRAKLGDTIVLGGTVGRVDIKSDSGFPFLKDLPGVQYFFSNDQTLSVRTSVLFLLTPRSFGHYRKEMKQYLSEKNEGEKRPNLTELERRHKDWLYSQSNLVPILQTFGPMYQDFRLGDIMNYDWTCPPAFDRQLYNLADFLWN